MAHNNDLEITRACAEAMGLEERDDSEELYIDGIPPPGLPIFAPIGQDCYYDPLHDDAQAMALVKKLHLWIRCDRGAWSVVDSDDETKADNIDSMVSGWGNDLNRAICECVAKIQSAKETV